MTSHQAHCLTQTSAYSHFIGDSRSCQHEGTKGHSSAQLITPQGCISMPSIKLLLNHDALHWLFCGNKHAFTTLCKCLAEYSLGGILERNLL